MRQFLDPDLPERPYRPLKVALFVHAFYPDHVYGTEFYTLALARCLSELGHAPVVVTARSAGEPPQAQEIESYTYAGIPVLRIDRNRMPPQTARDIYHQPALAPLLTRTLKEIAPDVVHICHLGNFTAVLPEVAAALGIPVFATLTDFFNLCLSDTLERPDGSLCLGPDAGRRNCLACGLAHRGMERPSLFWQAVAHPRMRDISAVFAARLGFLLPPSVRADARAVLRRPDVLLAAMERYRAAIAPTGFLKDVFLAHGARTPLVRSSFGVDIDRRPKPRRDAGPVRFGFIGQLLYHKGPHLLLQALRTLPPHAFTLDIWGSEQLAPDYARDLRAVAATLPVTFRGTFDAPAMADVMGEMDVAVLSSTWYENSPLTLLKALATHTPVVVSDVPGMTEFVTEGVNGFSFPRGDADGLAAVLRRFVEDPDLARTMSAATHFTRTERDMARDVLDLYRMHGVVPAAAGSLTA